MSIRDYLVAICRAEATPESLRFAGQLDAQDAMGFPDFLNNGSLCWPERTAKTLARWSRMSENHLQRLSSQRRREQLGMEVVR